MGIPATKVRDCKHCSEEFQSRKKNSYSWTDYCPTCISNRVWFGGTGGHRINFGNNSKIKRGIEHVDKQTKELLDG